MYLWYVRILHMFPTLLDDGMAETSKQGRDGIKVMVNIQSLIRANLFRTRVPVV